MKNKTRIIRNKILAGFLMLPVLILLLLFAQVLLSSCAPLPSQELPSSNPEERTRFCLSQAVSAYGYPYPGANVVAMLPKGTEVSLTLYQTNGWLEVESARGSGYVERWLPGGPSVVECEAKE